LKIIIFAPLDFSSGGLDGFEPTTNHIKWWQSRV